MRNRKASAEKENMPGAPKPAILLKTIFRSLLVLGLAAVLLPYAAAQATVVSSSKLQSCVADGTVRCHRSNHVARIAFGKLD